MGVFHLSYGHAAIDTITSDSAKPCFYSLRIKAFDEVRVYNSASIWGHNAILCSNVAPKVTITKNEVIWTMDECIETQNKEVFCCWYQRICT